jgi:hypothetical protein
MDLGALAWVERSNKIMVERGEGGDGNTISFKGLTYKLVTSPDTGRVWLASSTINRGCGSYGGICR